MPDVIYDGNHVGVVGILGVKNSWNVGLAIGAKVRDISLGMCNT